MKRNSPLLLPNAASFGRWIYIIMALVLLTVSGCMTAREAKFQKEVAVPMLIQENRQLEDELFHLREQFNRCCYDNQQLREQVAALQSKTDTASPAASSRLRLQNGRQDNSTAAPAWSPTR